MNETNASAPHAHCMCTADTAGHAHCCRCGLSEADINGTVPKGGCVGIEYDLGGEG